MKHALTDRLGDISKWNVGETFGVPHTFNPDLTLREALVAVAVAFSRIFLGSLVFALWGVAAWTTYDAIRNPILRTLALLPIVVLFLVSMAALMAAITFVVNRAHRRKSAPSI